MTLDTRRHLPGHLPYILPLFFPPFLPSSLPVSLHPPLRACLRAISIKAHVCFSLHDYFSFFRHFRLVFLFPMLHFVNCLQTGFFLVKLTTYLEKNCFPNVKKNSEEKAKWCWSKCEKNVLIICKNVKGNYIIARCSSLSYGG